MRYDTKYEIHPAAELFPMLSDEAYAQLRDDIRQHGQLDEIILFEGRVLDGRNRLRACVELGIDPFHAELEECKSPVAYVLSKNLHRRHLTSSQLAAVATKALPLLEEEAGVRKSEGQKSGGRGKKKTLPNELGKDKHDRAAAEQAAKLTGSNRQYVQDAKKIATADPELFKKVESGEVTIPQAKRILEPPKKPERKPAPAEPNVIGSYLFELRTWAERLADEAPHIRLAVKEGAAGIIEAIEC